MKRLEEKSFSSRVRKELSYSLSIVMSKIIRRYKRNQVRDRRKVKNKRSQKSLRIRIDSQAQVNA